MPWADPAESVVRALLEMVPGTLRPLAETSARAEAEALAADRGANTVEVDDAVRGWIRITPEDQRDGLVAVLEGLGLDVETYADDLVSAFEEQPEG